MGKHRRNSGGKKLLKTLNMLGKVMQRALLLPPLFLFLVICFWITSSLLPKSVLHVCISGGRFSVYCVSAGTTPFPQQAPIDLDKISPHGDHEGNGISQELKVEKHGLRAIASPFPKVLVSDGFSAQNAPELSQISKRENPQEEHNGSSETSNKSYEMSSMEKVVNMSNEIIVMAKESNPQGQFMNVTEDRGFALNVVKMKMEAIRAASMPRGIKNGVQTSCKGRQIFVYNLPSKFNADLVNQCSTLLPWFNLCDYFSNGGMGNPIESFHQNWYQTHQYSLEIIFHSRISKHSCLVSKPEEANIFYIPYYGGLDVVRWNFKDNVSNDKRDELGLELVNWLESQPWWRKYGGRDHVLVLGKVSWDFRRLRDTDLWGSKLLQLPQMQSLTKLLIERQPWHINEIGVPHPTFFHPHSDEDIRQWQSQINASERHSLISFAGAPRPNSTDSIRSILIEQCLGRPELCKFLNCKIGRVCFRPESTINLFMHSEFCLQPPGDSPTRRSVFDSLIAGCIPVLFDPFTAYYQYPWHLPANDSSYSVFISQEDVRARKVNIIDALHKIPEEQRKEMRRNIINEIMPGLVYGDPDAKFNEFQDAFTISVNNLLWGVAKGMNEAL